MSDLQKWVNEMAVESKKGGLSFSEFCDILETKFDLDSIRVLNRLHYGGEGNV